MLEAFDRLSDDRRKFTPPQTSGCYPCNIHKWLFSLAAEVIPRVEQPDRVSSLGYGTPDKWSQPLPSYQDTQLNSWNPPKD